MILLSIEECKKFNIEVLDYDSKEIEIRENNKNMLFSVSNFLLDKKYQKYLNDLSADIPYIFVDFYKTYISEKPVSKQKVLSSIKKECHCLDVKLNNFCKKWGYERDYINNEIKNNNILLLSFVKEPSKQTFHQHFAAKWLEKLPFIEDFKELLAGGNAALHIVEGQVVNGLEERKQNYSCKSIDFFWKYTFGKKELCFYATHKYTKESGGSQDHQYNEVQNFLKEAMCCTDKNKFFFGITDGPYYNLREASFKDYRISKMDYMNKEYQSDKTKATTINIIAKDTIDIIEKWLKRNFSENEIKTELEKLNILRNNC